MIGQIDELGVVLCQGGI